MQLPEKNRDDDAFEMPPFTVTTEGLDQFFEVNAAPDAGLTLKQAMHYYNLPAKAIKEKIRGGEIPAVRNSTDKGKKWRVYPDGIPNNLLFTPEPLLTYEDDMELLPGKFARESEPIEPVEPIEAIEPQALEVKLKRPPSKKPAPAAAQPIPWEQTLGFHMQKTIRELEFKLEGASFRIGYLEAQLASREEKIRLISLRTREVSWWERILETVGVRKGAQAQD